MKRCIVNLSTQKYRRGQNRLIESLRGKTDAHLAMYTHEATVGAPLHTENKYAFKTYALNDAFNNGYDVLLWLDASMYVLRDLKPIFEHIEEHGYLFQDSGWFNNRWTNIRQRKYFGTNKGKMISSGVVGIDLRSPEGLVFFHRWHRASKDGIFHGSHEDSRHDQTAASLIIEQMGLSITENETYWKYGNPEETYPDNILILAHGII